MFLQNLRHSLRQLKLEPVFAIVALLSISLGIGATTGVLSVIYAVALHPFPYSGAERMVNIHLYDASGDRGGVMLSGMQFLELQKADLFDGAIAMDNWDMAMNDGSITEAVRAGHLSSNAFSYFGVPPLLGRTFTQADAPVGQEPDHVVVLSYKFWKSHYGGRKDVLGQVINLDKVDYTVIGVMPRRFTWGESDVYLCLKIVQDPERTNAVFARLKPGVTTAMANAQLQSLMEQFARDLPEHFPRQFRVRVVGTIEYAVGDLSGTLLILLGAVSLLLVIGCSNLSILLLARGTSREHEFAMRSALGASRGQIIYQLLTEGVTLCLMGALMGIGIAYAGVPFIVRFLPPDVLPSEVYIHVNSMILLCTMLVAVASGVFSSLAPALRFSKTDPAKLLNSGAQRSIGSMQSKRIFSLLIGSQIAITVVLLAGGGASFVALYRLLRTPLGYDPHSVIEVSIPLSDGSFTKWGERVAYYDQIRQRVSQAPSAVSAALTAFSLPPITDYHSSIELVGSASNESHDVVLQQVSPEYFGTLHIPLLNGRIWTQSENMYPAHVAVINQAMAKRFWPNDSPIGKTVKVRKLKAYTTWMLDSPQNDGSVQIVGLVGDVPNDGLRAPVLPTLYAPYTLVALDGLQLIVRTRGDPAEMMRTIGEDIHAVNPAQAVTGFRNAEDILSSGGWGTERFIASLFVPFALIATILSAVGLFSVISYTISRRTREIGVRMALGAERVHIVGAVLAPISSAVSGGLVLGVVLTISVSKIVAHWTEVSISNPLILAGAAVIALVVSCSSAFIPAFRAAHLEPMEALRDD